MRILFFSNEFPGPSDPLKAVFNLRMCEALAARHDVRVVAPRPWTEGIRLNRPMPRIPFPVLYPIHYFPPAVLHSVRGTFMWWSLRRTLTRLTTSWQPDVVLGYWVHPDGEVGLRLARALGVPFVQMVGGSDVLLGSSDRRRWARILSVLDAADAVIAIGGQLAEHIVNLGIDSHRVTAMYRSVDVARFSPGSKAMARARLGLPQDAPIVLWVGRLVAVKNVDSLLRAFVHVRAVRPEAELHLIGDGPELPLLMDTAKACDVLNLVKFHGAVTQESLPDWYRSADVTALPSRSEGLPNVLMESLACGTPFVASAVGSIKELADPELDRLVPVGNVDGLAQALVELLDHRSLERLRLSRVPAAAAGSIGLLEDVLRRVIGHQVAVAS